jgi:pterin-4a-carbinolamine dehydratase
MRDRWARDLLRHNDGLEAFVSAEETNHSFISYSRDDGGPLAMLLYQRLRDHDIDVFYDFESLGAGKFEEIILGQISARPYFLVALAPRSAQNISKPNSWFRREIEHAMTTERQIVPCYLQTFDFDDLDRHLHGPIGETLRRANGCEMPQAYFDAAVDRLVRHFLLPVELDTTPTPPGDRPAVAQIREQAQSARTIISERLLTEYPIALSDGDLDGALSKTLSMWIREESILPEAPGKSRVEISRELQFSSFLDAIDFMSRIAPFIDGINHHPRWENIYRSLKISLTSWDVDHRPTQVDLMLASKIDEIFGEYEATKSH